LHRYVAFYFNEWTCQLWDRWEVNKSGAFEWAQRAIEQDDQNHVIAMVLGRIFLYEGSYDTAEYYFRKSLMLNSNDPETLMPLHFILSTWDWAKKLWNCLKEVWN
jgi:uncharacterized protein HemY